MSDELAGLLRELADTAETPPPVSGADVRATAGRRRRRRRTTAAVAGGCVAAALAAFLTLNLTAQGTQQRPSPAASADPTFTPATPDATVDLSRRVLIVADRELPISAGTFETPTPTGLMTVTAKSSTKIVTGGTVGLDDAYEMKLPWVLELSPIEATATTDANPNGREGTDGAENGVEEGGDVGDGTRDTADTSAPTDPAAPRETGEASEAGEASEVGEAGEAGASKRADGSPTPTSTPPLTQTQTQTPDRPTVYIAALTYDEKAPGNYDTTPGWIGLRSADARWLYERLAKGAIVEFRGAAPTPEPTPTGTMTPAPALTAPTTDDDGPVAATPSAGS